MRFRIAGHAKPLNSTNSKTRIKKKSVRFPAWIAEEYWALWRCLIDVDVPKRVIDSAKSNDLSVTLRVGKDGLTQAVVMELKDQ